MKSYNPKNIILLVSFLFIFSACTKDDPSTNSQNFSVNNQLLEYYERFESEAALRGRTIDLEEDHVSGYLQAITDTEETVYGQCKTSSNGDVWIIIDESYWNTASDLEKEFIVFHELGHCYLGRSHDNSVNSNGTCSSIMQSGISGCRNAYNNNTRSNYLDELFNN